MMRLDDLMTASRLFQSRNIDELFDALNEDDDGPDGGSALHRKRAKGQQPAARRS
ncbi:hypothetical protein [Shimia sp. SDUM112013]|uniref:hypothetical protein n=1 Tax=Shimia sp. SDUM112013 TaxID=3136160 RepID=UPI0032EBDF75